MARAIPNGWLLYLAAFDARLDALARGDQDAARGARALMTQLHKELASYTPDRCVVRGLKHEAEVRELLAILEARSSTDG